MILAQSLAGEDGQAQWAEKGDRTKARLKLNQSSTNRAICRAPARRAESIKSNNSKWHRRRCQLLKLC